MAYQTLIAEQLDGAVALLALNRPHAANALNMQMALEIKDFFDSLGDARAVVLAGQGKHFCAGADLKERQGMDKSAWHTQHAAFEAARDAILYCKLPVIAAVAGAAVGGGLELALATDFIYSATQARFGLSETTLGIIPGLGGTQTLPDAVGKRRAKEMIYTGGVISAEEAWRTGLVNRLCAPQELLRDAITTAKIIAANAPLAVKAAKQAIDGSGLKEALALELRYYESLLESADRHEGVNAFNEKRKPIFKGE